jgi:predicted TIM-barrel fold metal-dependent hydrolase
MERVVIVQPSVYGTDNSCTVDAVLRLGKRARAVVVIDGDVKATPGVCGVRVNLHTGGVHDAATAQRQLQEAAARVAPLGWHVQTFTSLALLRDMRPLNVPLVIDHFGLPRDAADVEYLAQLLRTSDVYVKLSGTHRLPMDPGPAVRALVAAAPDRCLWGSDWPHPTSGKRDAREIQPFDEIDDAASLRRLHQWVGDEALFRKILVDNPARLYDFQAS